MESAYGNVKVGQWRALWGKLLLVAAAAHLTGQTATKLFLIRIAALLLASRFISDRMLQYVFT